MANTQRKKRRRSRKSEKRKGVMMGMHSGFKKLGHSVTGAGEKEEKKTSIAGTIVTVVLVLAAAAMLYQRFG